MKMEVAVRYTNISNIFTVLAVGALVFGIALVTLGIILAVVLKKKYK